MGKGGGGPGEVCVCVSRSAPSARAIWSQGDRHSVSTVQSFIASFVLSDRKRLSGMVACPRCGALSWDRLPFEAPLCSVGSTPGCGAGRGAVCAACGTFSCGECLRAEAPPEGAPTSSEAAPAAAAVGRSKQKPSKAAARAAVAKPTAKPIKKRKMALMKKKKFSCYWDEAQQLKHNLKVLELDVSKDGMDQPIVGGTLDVEACEKVLKVLREKWDARSGTLCMEDCDPMKGYNQWSSTIGKFSATKQAKHTLKFKERDQRGNTMKTALAIPGMADVVAEARQVPQHPRTPGIPRASANLTFS